jgi:hypothetical protein
MASIEDLSLLPKPRSVVACKGAYRLIGGYAALSASQLGLSHAPVEVLTSRLEQATS